MDERLHVIAVLNVKAERLGEAVDLLRALAPPSREEPGCIAYYFVQDTSNSSVILSTETWRDQQAFQEHIASEHFVSTLEQLQPLLVTQPIIHTCNTLV
ncbi:putative quinol monooxygenase [Aeoliella sp.]|uniref:putative quinol monooxygenase n=1 Tax=Aeoliella sp. TaxID=2795800 RepID=UPI003CCC0C86